MRLQRDYVQHIARAVVERLLAAEMIETATPGPVMDRVHQVLLEELSIEDRINDKVRAYMNQYEDQIRRSGVSYQEMFKRIKSELVRREKVIL